MRRDQLDKYIKDNNLLQSCKEHSGIYAITIDKGIVYVGKSKNLYQRCSQHIYNTENAILNQEKKYLLLLSAKLGGHSIDCYALEYCDTDMLTEREDYFIEYLDPCLNILTPTGKNDISGLKIEDVLNRIQYSIE